MSIRCYNDPQSPNTHISIEDPWIEDDIYKTVLEKTIITCVDAVLTLSGNEAIYLAKRNVLPMKGFWCMGGRINFNDRTPEEAISRILSFEGGSIIAPNRFHFTTSHLYSWTEVVQGKFPGKNLSLIYRVELTSEELQFISAHLKESEYDRSFGIQRFDRKRLVEEGVHKAMLDTFDDFFKR